MFGVDHLWPWGRTGDVVTYDPEGLVATLGALVNVLVDAAASALLMRSHRRATLTALAIAGAACLLAGFLLDPLVPVVKKLWTPIVTPDYTPYLAQIGDVDVVVQGFAGSNPLRFMQQYRAFGLQYPVLGGETAGDDARLNSFGNDAIGLIRQDPYRLARDVRGIGFLTADQVAVSLGVARDAPERLRAGLSFALQQARDDGHTGLPRHEAILTAIRNRDPLGARQATLVQLQETGDDLSSVLSTKGIVDLA